MYSFFFMDFSHVNTDPRYLTVAHMSVAFHFTLICISYSSQSQGPFLQILPNTILSVFHDRVIIDLRNIIITLYLTLSHCLRTIFWFATRAHGVNLSGFTQISLVSLTLTSAWEQRSSGEDDLGLLNSGCLELHALHTQQGIET